MVRIRVGGILIDKYRTINNYIELLMLTGRLITPLVYRCYVYLVQFGSNWRTLGELANSKPFGN
ncbi:hypothetical protein ES708_11409 [subsurface metagenome]